MTSRWTPQDLASYQARNPRLRMQIVSVEPKGNKYKAKKTEVDGITFASKREATRYQDLKLMEQLGLIHDLKLQVRHGFVINGHKIGSYRSDFEYEENGEHVVEDCKGYHHRDYIWRKKLMLALHGIAIRET